MPIYMDAHLVPGVKAREVAEAHQHDLNLQSDFGCKCMTYWVDEERETIFCLMDAPDKDTVRQLHNKAHGLVPNKIIEVSSSIVQSFLGRIYDPESAIVENGMRIFSDPSFRVLLFTKTEDIVLLRNNMNVDAADELIARQNEIIRKNIQLHEGSEVENDKEGFIISFKCAADAMNCAVAIQKDIPEKDKTELGLRMAINSGEPVQNSQQLFGDTMSFALQLLSVAKPTEVIVAASVKELVIKDFAQKIYNQFVSHALQDEEFIQSLFKALEENWHNPDFDVPEYCQALAMSQSQLYRKTTSLTGVSLNTLLKDYRLEKAKELLKKKNYSVSQATFESGFTSPSYFTKCFKARYGLLPLSYISLL
jgi:AraC-like DNA-binding protein